jgi:hypothetical protein
MKTNIGVFAFLLSVMFALPALAQFNIQQTGVVPWSLDPKEKIAVGSSNIFYNEMIDVGTPTYYLSYKKELKLTQDQIKKLKTKRMEDIKATNDLVSRFNVANTELLDLLDEQETEMTKVEQKIREIEKLRADYQVAIIRNQNDARNMLTLEQKEKAEQYKVARNNPASPVPQYRNY